MDTDEIVDALREIQRILADADAGHVENALDIIEDCLDRITEEEEE